MPYTMEIVEYPLYDTEDLEEFGRPVDLFMMPVGSSRKSKWHPMAQKNFWETNAFSTGTLENRCMFMVRDIQVLLYDADGLLPVFDRTGIGDLWAKSYLQFIVNCRIYWQGPLSLLADPVCQIGGLDALRGMPIHALESTFQMLNYQAKHPLNISLQEQQPFRVRVVPYTKIRRQVSVRVVLNGQMTRPAV